MLPRRTFAPPLQASSLFNLPRSDVTTLFSGESTQPEKDSPSVPEQKNHDQRMRKPHLGPIHKPIAHRLDQGEDVVVGRIEQECVEGLLRGSEVSVLSVRYGPLGFRVWGGLGALGAEGVHCEKGPQYPCSLYTRSHFHDTCALYEASRAGCAPFQLGAGCSFGVAEGRSGFAQVAR